MPAGPRLERPGSRRPPCPRPDRRPAPLVEVAERRRAPCRVRARSPRPACCACWIATVASPGSGSPSRAREPRDVADHEDLADRPASVRSGLTVDPPAPSVVAPVAEQVRGQGTGVHAGRPDERVRRRSARRPDLERHAASARSTRRSPSAMSRTVTPSGQLRQRPCRELEHGTRARRARRRRAGSRAPAGRSAESPRRSRCGRARERARDLDAGRAAADDHERQPLVLTSDGSRSARPPRAPEDAVPQSIASESDLRPQASSSTRRRPK